MKRYVKLIVLMNILLICFSGCGKSVDTDPSDSSSEVEEQTTNLNSNECIQNDFELKIYSDNSLYTNEDEIKVWATLEYVGEEESVTITSGDPYIIFTIVGDDDFSMDGAVNDVLIETELLAGEVYHFDFAKSGGYSADDPDADYWEAFYAEKKLYLPEGDYTIKVIGAFNVVGEGEIETESGLSCGIEIRVD